MCPMPRSTQCDSAEINNDGWCPFQFKDNNNKPTGLVYCVANSAKSNSLGSSEPITSLSAMHLRGALFPVNNQNVDSIIASYDQHTVTGITVPARTRTAAGSNYFRDLDKAWQGAEFNVFGLFDGDQAVFNQGSTILVRTRVDNGTTDQPNCVNKGSTGESNSLSLVMTPNSCCAFGGISPSVEFVQSNNASAKSVCTAPEEPPRCLGSFICLRQNRCVTSLLESKSAECLFIKVPQTPPSDFPN
jgi:hypothetical protein